MESCRLIIYAITAIFCLEPVVHKCERLLSQKQDTDRRVKDLQ